MLQGLFCATCFFLPEVLYQVRFELSNASLHVGKKNYLIEMKSDIFKKFFLLQRNATY